MKKIIFFFIIMLAALLETQGQNVGINAPGTLPDASAMLDVSSTSKGLLIPRMTTAQRNAIATPASGLQVYDTDAKSFWFYNGTGWIEISTGSATNFWGLNGTHIFNNNTGNVGIGLNTPLAPLHIKNDNEALRLQGNTPYLSFASNAGVAKGFLQSFNDDLYLGTPSTNTTGKMQFYLKNIPLMTMLPSGNVGIGTATPANKFTVQTAANDFGFTHTDGTVTVGSYIGDFGTSGTGGWLGTKTNHPLNFFTNNSLAQITLLQNGNMGIGTTNPLNKLQIGTVASVFADYDFAIGRNAQTAAIYQGPNFTNLISTANILINPKFGTGYVGVSAGVDPTNKLQIGTLGNTGFAGNDLAIGNGTNAVAVYQSNVSTLIGSSTDIILRPKNNGNGFVGINTIPGYPLHVSGFKTIVSPYAYYARSLSGGGAGTANFGTNQGATNISIYASDRIMGSEFNAFSDARIKNIKGVSNTTEDLQIINAIQITDYTLKDEIKNGNLQYKKVIAQQVEKVYPQVVSKHTDFIPNVYQLTSSVTKTDQGFLLTFKNAHHIHNTAKRLQAAIEGDGGMQQFDIVSIPSANEVIINAAEIKGIKIFVYGQEVDDFRTVDYEGLTTLNISATQELNKRIKKQQFLINKQHEQLQYLQKRMALLEAKITFNKASVRRD